MKLELHLDWKRTVKTIMTMRGLSNSDLAQAAGTQPCGRSSTNRSREP